MIKKYGYPVLALILLVMFLMCSWVGGYETTPQTTLGNGGNLNQDPGDDEQAPPYGEPDWVTCSEYDRDDTTLNDGDNYLTTWALSCDPGHIHVKFERFVEGAGAYTGDVSWTIQDSTGAVIFYYTDNANVLTFDQFGGTPDWCNTAMWDGATPWSFSLINNCGQSVVYAFEIEMQEARYGG